MLTILTSSSSVTLIYILCYLLNARAACDSSSHVNVFIYDLFLMIENPNVVDRAQLQNPDYPIKKKTKYITPRKITYNVPLMLFTMFSKNIT